MAFPHVPEGGTGSLTEEQRGTLEGAAWMGDLARLLSLRPAVMVPVLSAVEAVLTEAGALSTADRLTVAIAIARIHDCDYLVDRLAARLTDEGADEELVTALSRDDRLARVAPRTRALLDFAILIAEDAHLVSRVSINDLRARADLVAEDVVDLVQLVGVISHLAHAAITFGLGRPTR